MNLKRGRTSQESDNEDTTDEIRNNAKSARLSKIQKYKCLLENEGSNLFLTLNISSFPTFETVQHMIQSIKTFDSGLAKRASIALKDDFEGWSLCISNKQSKIKEKIGRCVERFMNIYSWKAMSSKKVSDFFLYLYKSNNITIEKENHKCNFHRI